MFATLGLLWFHVPQRVAFAPWAGEFEALAADAPASEYRGAELGARIGPYRVDQYAADPAGGVYFRTLDAPDGIGPDTQSYGSALRPAPNGCPFGRSQYQLVHLFGDWYAFAVSND